MPSMVVHNGNLVYIKLARWITKLRFNREYSLKREKSHNSSINSQADTRLYHMHVSSYKLQPISEHTISSLYLNQPISPPSGAIGWILHLSITTMYMQTWPFWVHFWSIWANVGLIWSNFRLFWAHLTPLYHHHVHVVSTLYYPSLVETVELVSTASTWWFIYFLIFKTLKIN